VYRREPRRPEKAQYSGASWTVTSITSVAGTVVDGVAVERGGATVANCKNCVAKNAAMSH